MSGWSDLPMFGDKFEWVKDKITGEMIMVDKGAKKHELDDQGNIVGLGAASGGGGFGGVFGTGGGGGGGG
eukprot:CAMPEP_0119340106 /NCGR_PEP_ID=MMETSP1333-20130426/99668_1 /TAXON_ID=418940 /ORGANISM="Scyphosphaera apsteinii, Strain RCC1455" /LENGTH=69 /DNA_ID=CAMNT_0007351771 /DNA_START=29 /DNA_END=234 /DNA_ORIENTATION=+